MENIERFLNSIKHTFTTSTGVIAFLFSLLLTPNSKMILFFFISFLLCDYVTGIIASWMEFKAGKRESDGVYFLSSKRLRESGVKVLGYCLVITFAVFLNQVFFPSGVVLFGVTAPLTVVEIALSGCTAIEFLSNLENMKRAGFDVVGKLSSGFKTVWGLVRQAKGEDK